MRLLVAEDHPSLARSLADGLREQGYAVDLTFDGEEARHLASVNPYDAVVLDIMLPRLDGWQVLKAIRRQKPTMPVLCLTARDSVEDRVKGLDLGADDYLPKPFSWDEFLARVRSVIRRGHGQASSLLTIADMEIDLAKKSVVRNGTVITLSAREFALLEYLAHRQGEVVSRSDIWEHLYDQHDESISNVVDVYIGYLRGKIDKGFEKKLIHTRRGQGYVLGEEG
jgi:DNA-binding response OmpR family regulator